MLGDHSALLKYFIVGFKLEICMKRILLTTLGCLSVMNVTQASEKGFVNAIKGGQVNIDFRVRYENVNDEQKSANSNTLRSRLTFETLQYNLFSALVEFDDITAIPNDDTYNTSENNMRYRQ